VDWLLLREICRTRAVFPSWRRIVFDFRDVHGFQDSWRDQAECMGWAIFADSELKLEVVA